MEGSHVTSGSQNQSRPQSETIARDRVSRGLTRIRSQKPELNVKPESRAENL